MEKRLKAYILQQLRQISYKCPKNIWDGKDKALKASLLRKDGRSNIYQCNYCKGEFKSTQINRDHISPVVDLYTDDQSVDDYINRLFCHPDGIQILCESCHDKKTALERDAKASFKKAGKTKEQAQSELEYNLTLLIKKDS